MSASWPLSTDQTIAVAIGVPSIVLAGVAALFAARADFFVRAGSVVDNARRRRDVRPRLLEQWAGFSVSSVPEPLFMQNHGGTAVDFLWLGIAGTHVAFVASAMAGPSPATVTFQPEHLGERAGLAPAGTVVLVAQDVDDRWWDIRKEQPAPALEEYLTERLKAVQLEHLVPTILSRLPRRIPA